MKLLLIGVALCAGGGIYLFIRSLVRLSRNRNRVIAQSGARWYRYASEEFFSDRGKALIMNHFRETVEPDRARRGADPRFPAIAALAAYFHLLDEKGLDATNYDALPVDREAIAKARVLSRIAFPA
jgi:hypothetical protein